MGDSSPILQLCTAPRQLLARYQPHTTSESRISTPAALAAIRAAAITAVPNGFYSYHYARPPQDGSLRSSHWLAIHWLLPNQGKV